MNQNKEKDDQNHPSPPKSGGILGALRANFLTGLVVLAPVGITAYIFWTAIGVIDSWVLTWIPEKYHPSAYIGVNVHGIGSVIFLIFCVIVGYFAKGLFGRWILSGGELIVGRMPLVRSVYQALKQIAETVFQQTETSFDRACLIQYPREGLWAVAFYSTVAKGEILEKTPDVGKIISVFLPTTPNPTSGFLLFVPESDIIYLDMSVEDAAKLVISAGLVYPNPRSSSLSLPDQKPKSIKPKFRRAEGASNSNFKETPS